MYIDIQVNGYAGVDFNAEPPTSEQLQHVAARLRAGKVRAILPTFVTGSIPEMCGRIRAMRMLIEQDPALQALMPAYHIEGPCISPLEGYRGAHPPEHIRAASPEVFKPLFEAAGGVGNVALLTLAPEQDPGLKTARWLVEQGIVVCIGHSDAPLDTLREAEQAGVRLWTHLGNGCANTVHRHDNVLNRALSLEHMRYALIPDGHHVPFYVLKLWLKLLGAERCLFTTDAVTPADAPPGAYRVIGWDVVVGADGLVRPPGKTHLAGSSLRMEQAYDHAIHKLGLTPVQAKALTVDQPAALIGKWLDRHSPAAAR